MSNADKKSQCQMGCWGMGAAIGLIAFIMLMAVADFSFMAAAVLGILLFVILGALFSWLFCAPVPSLGERSAPKSVATPAASAASVTATSSAVPKTTEADEESVAKAAETAEKTADAEAAAKAAEAAAKAAEEQAAKEAETAKAAAEEKAKEAEATPDFDGDGVKEGTDEGAQPEVLDAPRDGKADNLKEIKGIGPKLEKACNSIGVYHFDQIANWSDDEVAWVNANLVGFKGRVTRDNWVEQAKILAAGGETEFSQRVDSGKVY